MLTQMHSCRGQPDHFRVGNWHRKSNFKQQTNEVLGMVGELHQGFASSGDSCILRVPRDELDRRIQFGELYHKNQNRCRVIDLGLTLGVCLIQINIQRFATPKGIPQGCIRRMPTSAMGEDYDDTVSYGDSSPVPAGRNKELAPLPRR